MIFQFTIDKVLSGEKCQTSRIWREDYTFSWDEYDRELPNVILSMKAWEAGKIRQLYRVGQILSVQPNRGQKGVAKIKVLGLAKRDVRDFDYEDAMREGFDGVENFLRLWVSLHDKWLFKVMKADKYSNISSRAKLNAPHRPAEFYQALVIRFELLP